MRTDAHMRDRMIGHGLSIWIWILDIGIIGIGGYNIYFIEYMYMRMWYIWWMCGRYGDMEIMDGRIYKKIKGLHTYPLRVQHLLYYYNYSRKLSVRAGAGVTP